MIVRLVRFHELTYDPRLLDCQQKLPAPSKVNGAVIVEVTGLHAPAPEVGVIVGVTGSGVRVSVFVIAGVTVRVREAPLVGEAPPVGVRVSVRVGDAPLVGVRVGVTLMIGVRVKVRVDVAVSDVPPPATTLTSTMPCEGTLAV